MLLRSERRTWLFPRCIDCASFVELGCERDIGVSVHGVRQTEQRGLLRMTLHELVDIIGNKLEIYLDGKDLTVLSDDMLNLEVERIHIKTKKPPDDLGSLGYSFEVGV